MSSQDLLSPHIPYSEPPFDIETRFEQGSPNNFFTGKRERPDRAHIVSTSRAAEGAEWLEEYVEGRKDFSDHRIEQARQFAADGQPAEAAIAGKIALDIPYRGSLFATNAPVVMNAMGVEVDIHTGTDEETNRAIRDRYLTSFLTATEEAFDIPYETKQEVEKIAEGGRADIKGVEIDAWTNAINTFGDAGDFHAAGVGAMELAEEHRQHGQTDEAVAMSRTATELFQSRLEVLVPGAGATAEVDVLHGYLLDSLKTVVDLCSEKGAVAGSDKEVLKAFVYDLDDIGLPAYMLGGSSEHKTAAQILRILEKGYMALAGSSRFKEKRFYKKEAKDIGEEIIDEEALAEHLPDIPSEWGMDGATVALWSYSSTHKDRRHLRPNVNL